MAKANAGNLLAALKSTSDKPQALKPSTTVAFGVMLIDAAKADNIDGIQKALEEPKTKVDQKDHEGYSALMYAAERGYVDVCKLLIEKGSRILSKDDNGETAVMKACKSGQLEIVKLLIEALVEQWKQKARPMLIQSSGDDAADASIKEAKRFLDAKDDEGVTSLMKASETGEFEVCKYLLELGASADVKDDEGWTAMMWAALTGQLEIVEHFVSEHNQQADYTTEKGETALSKASANGHTATVEFLIKEGSKVNHHDENFQSALMWAAANGHLDTCAKLVELDAKVDHTTKLGKTPLMLAAQFGRLEVCEYLIEKGCKVDVQDAVGENALYPCIEHGHDDVVTLLLDKKNNEKAFIDAHTKKGESALMRAAKNHQVEIVELLIARGADLYKQDENGQTATDHAEGTLNSSLVTIFRNAQAANPQ